MSQIISIRGHHLLCLQGFQGHGYSADFVENFWTILKALKENPDLEFQVTKDCDVFCEACPHRKDTICAKDENAQERMQGLDERALQRLSLSAGYVQNAQNLLESVNTKLKTTRDVEGICSACQWREKCVWYQKLEPV